MKKHIFLIVALVALGIATTNVTAATDYALRFSQDGQGVQVPHSESLNLNGNFTIEAWIYAEPPIYNAYYNFIISKHMNGTGYVLGASGRDKDSKFIAGGQGDTQVETTFTLPAKQWMHVALVSNEDTNSLYVNGLLISETINQQPPLSNTEDLFIGHSPFGAELNWKGAIDEVRIWNISRTQEEIYQDMYAKPRNRKGLMAYWDFNDDPKKAVAADKSGNKNNGVLFSNGASPNLPKMFKSHRPSLLTRPMN